jgi:hypothetical protein
MCVEGVRVANAHGEVSALKLYLSLPLAFLGQQDKARSLADKGLGNLKSPTIKARFAIHLSTLRDRFPEEREFAAFSRTIDPI